MIQMEFLITLKILRSVSLEEMQLKITQFSQLRCEIYFIELMSSYLAKINIERAGTENFRVLVCVINMLVSPNLLEVRKFIEERGNLEQSEYSTSWSWPPSTCAKTQICQLWQVNNSHRGRESKQGQHEIPMKHCTQLGILISTYNTVYFGCSSYKFLLLTTLFYSCNSSSIWDYEYSIFIFTSIPVDMLHCLNIN